MTLEAILHDEDLRRREFPVAAEKVFWAHAAVTSLRRTRDGTSVLRLSPHFYNTDKEWSRLRSALSAR